MFINLYKEMKSKGFTQKDLAKALNVSAQTISYKMTGKRDFTSNEMFTIQKEFFPDVKLEELFKK